jgi:hypothetical protein
MNAMPLAVIVVWVGFAAAIGMLIWRQEKRDDRQAHILGLAPKGRDSIGILAVALSSALVAICPTLLVWVLLL